MNPVAPPVIRTVSQRVRHWLTVIAITTLVVLLSPVQAAPVVIDTASSGKGLNADVDLFIDQTDHMNVEQVRADAHFEPSHGVVGLGLIPHPVWLRITLNRNADTPARWWLEMQPFSVDELSLYRPEANGQYSVQTAGDAHPFRQRPFAYRQYLYPVDLPANQPVTLYFRVVTLNASILPLRIWQLEDWSQRALLEYLLLGACIGVLVGLGLYNLLLYLRLRDRLYLVYSLTMVSFTLFAADLNGLGSQLLWPDSGYRITGLNQALIALYAMLLTLFPLWLLQGGGLTRWFDRLLYLFVGLYGITIVTALLGWFGFTGVVIHYAAFPVFVLLIGGAVYRALKGFRPAWYYLLGHGPVIFSLNLLLLLGRGQAEASVFNRMLFVVAGAWEAIMFSQALAERINLFMHEKELAQQLALEEKTARLRDAEQHEKELEYKVKFRTLELAEEVENHKRTLDLLRKSEEQLTHMAYYDAMTGLPNRRMLMERFDYLLGLAKRQQSRFALALIDLDRLKAVNDTHGHDVGDELLIKVAHRLRDSVRETDIVGRLGGDEFVVLFSAPLDDDLLNVILERIRAAFDAPIHCNGLDADNKLSIGVAWCLPDDINFDDHLKKADVAMYQAKKSGGDSYRIAA